MATLKKMAILRVTPEALRALLQLPPGAELVRVELAPGARGLLNLMIEGAGWDTPEGAMVQPADHAICTVVRDEAGNPVRTTIDWRLPDEGA